MIRLIPTLVAGFLLLFVFIAYQTMLIEQNDKKADLLKSEAPPASQAVPMENGGPHSYFLPPRMESARSLTIGAAPATQVQTGQTAAETLPASSVRGNAQDLLRSGYLGDNQATYETDFGAGRNQ